MTPCAGRDATRDSGALSGGVWDIARATSPYLTLLALQGTLQRVVSALTDHSLHLNTPAVDSSCCSKRRGSWQRPGVQQKMQPPSASGARSRMSTNVQRCSGAPPVASGPRPETPCSAGRGPMRPMCRHRRALEGLQEVPQAAPGARLPGVGTALSCPTRLGTARLPNGGALDNAYFGPFGGGEGLV